MITKIFKIPTQEMWTLRNKQALINFIWQETHRVVSNKLTIKQLVNYLPVDDYCVI